MAELPTLFVATPSGRDPKWPFPQCLAEMLLLTRKFKAAKFNSQLVYSSDWARCVLAAKAIEEGFTHTLFLDDDMYFPHDTADRLVSHGKPIMACNYTSRMVPVKPLACDVNGRVRSRDRSGIQKVDFAPTGVMLIDNRVFASIAMPWFKTEWLGPGPDDWQSDDFWFCQRARAAGFDIWIDHDLSQQIGHVGNHTFSHFMLPREEAEGPEDVLTLAREMIGTKAA